MEEQDGWRSILEDNFFFITTRKGNKLGNMNGFFFLNIYMYLTIIKVA